MSAAVQVAPGLTVTADMTPTERYNAIAKAQGAPTVERPVLPPQWHTDATIQRMAQGDAELARSAKPGNDPAQPHAGRIAPSPEELARQNGADPVAQFDAEMRAAGRQRPLPSEQPQAGRGTEQRTGARSDVSVDQTALMELQDIYRNLPPHQRTEKRAIYERDLQTLYEGRRRGESLQAFRTRQAAEAGTSAPLPATQAGLPGHETMRGQDAIEALQAEWRSMSPAEQADNEADFRAVLTHVENGAALKRNPETGALESVGPEAAQPAQPKAPGWQSHVKGGEWVDLDKITLEDTHGYTIPRYVSDQTLNVSTFDLLRQAKAAGITQDQINAVFQQQAIGNGWIKV